jgi:PAS domain S-box-containing protein
MGLSAPDTAPHIEAMAPSRLRALSSAASAATFVAGAAVLVGWVFGVEVLKRPTAGITAVNPVTAVCFCLGGLSLWARRHAAPARANRAVADAAAAALVAIGSLALLSVQAGVGPEVDRLLFSHDLAGNRMAPNTALNFILLGLALLVRDARGAAGRVAAEVLPVAAVLLALLALVGYAYGVRKFYGLAAFNPMSPYTGLTFMVLSGGVLLCRPGRGVVALLASDSTGGAMMRRLLPAALTVPVVLGWTHLAGHRGQLYGPEFGAALQAVGNIVVFLALVSWAAWLLAHIDARRTLAEEGLHRSEEKFRQLVAAVDQVFWISSLDGRKVFYVSPAYERVWGRPAERLYADAGEFLDGVHPDDRPSVLAALDGQAKDGYFEATFRVVRPNGVVRWVHSRGFPVCGGDGRVERVAGVVEDVTDRKRAQDALRDGEERLRSIIDNTTASVYIKDLSGRYLLVNGRVEALLGRPRDQIVGRTDYDLLPKAVAEAVTANDRRLTEAGRATEFEEVMEFGGERRTFLSVKFPLRNAAGEVYGTCGISTDITERKRAEQELARAKAAAEAANQSKSEFLANMSHEIRTPMTAIIGHAELLLEPDRSPSDRLDSVNAIRRSGQHLLTVINDILDLSKIEAGKMTVERVECDPCRAVGEVASLLRPRAQEKGLAFEVAFETPLPRLVESDPTRLRQVLFNLVGNAVKFTSSGLVRVVVRLEDRPQGGPVLCFEVNDTGVGMTAEQLARLFRPFQQADGSTTRQFGGTGLGLTICKRLANLLGGDIDVQSRTAAGSRFTLWLPAGELRDRPMIADPAEAMRLSEGPEHRQADGAGAAPGLLRGRVLLAEDGRENQVVLAAYLRKAGLEVAIANDGREAVELVRARPFDLVLMDMQMPHLDGYGAARTLRREGFTLPIVALTAHAMSEDRHKCLAAGCTDYLSKPVTRHDLLETVRKYLPATEAGPPAAEPARPAPGAKDLLRSELAEDPEMAPFLPGFLAVLPEKVAALASLRRRTDLEELRRVLHQLKGSGGMYGFPQITDSAAEAERRVKEQEPLQAVQAAVEELVRLVRSVEGYDATREQAPPAPESSDATPPPAAGS